MSDDVWTRAEPTSPCVKVCVMDPTAGLCIGCRRTLDEIAGWSRMSNETRRSIMATLADRPMPRKRQGGRAARTGKTR